MQPWEDEALCSRKLRTEVRGKPSSDVTQKTGLLPEVLGLSGREVRKDFWVPSRITDLHMVKDKQILCHGACEAQYHQSMRMGNERNLHLKIRPLRPQESWGTWEIFFSAIEGGKNISACVPKRNGCGQKGRRWRGGGWIVFTGFSESDINNAELGKS